jgi:hypothetical protein
MKLANLHEKLIELLTLPVRVIQNRKIANILALPKFSSFQDYLNIFIKNLKGEICSVLEFDENFNFSFG